MDLSVNFDSAFETCRFFKEYKVENKNVITVQFFTFFSLS